MRFKATLISTGFETSIEKRREGGEGGGGGGEMNYQQELEEQRKHWQVREDRGP